MTEARGPAIKLFGKTIQLPENRVPTADLAGVLRPLPSDGDFGEYNRSSPSTSSPPPNDTNESIGIAESHKGEKGRFGENFIGQVEDEAHSWKPKELTDPRATPLTDQNPKTHFLGKESETATTSKAEEEQSETSNSNNALKKPNAILLCPRCNSKDTKFCYYNNYNVNQPRHFCKDCKRYWTAGGTTRNVPVGTVRRRSKSSASLSHQLTVSKGIHHSKSNLSKGSSHSSD